MESKKQNKLVNMTKQKQTHREKKLVVNSGERGTGRGDVEAGVSETNYCA